MKRALLGLALAALLPALGPGRATPHGVSYSYVEGGYVKRRLGSTSDFDGFALAGSIGFRQQLVRLGRLPPGR